MIDKALVETCYLAILGRRPESAAVVEDKIARLSSAAALVGELLASPEFQDRTPGWVTDDYFHQAPRIDVAVPGALRQALFDRLRRQWGELGRSEPFWSVLTHDQYRTANLDAAAMARFYDTGAEHAALVELFCSRNRAEIRRGICVELGCGVGRVTKHLASRFETVIAIDISEGALRECRAMAEREGLANIDCRLLTAPDELARLGRLDFFYSVITLQHSQPPVQAYILDILLSKLKRGGGFLFQTQTYYPGYRFVAEEHLASAVETMDMHSLPMHEVLRRIAAHGHAILEVTEDMWTGRRGSHTFFGQARPRRSLRAML
jgi:2-polyprenyl-3-methyl-5-hydroxy-6-metoxy-1,4-benzoquinol methylase